MDDIIDLENAIITVNANVMRSKIKIQKRASGFTIFLKIKFIKAFMNHFISGSQF